MKTYIILTNGIEGISGAIIYVRNKIKYMESLGWHVELIYANKGTIYIDDLKQYTNQFNALLDYPVCYKKKRIKKILDDMLSVLSYPQTEHECIIESTNYRMACWAELLADKLKAKHIMYLVTENPFLLNRGMFNFYWFKYQRNELRGINKNSLHRLFEKYIHVESNEKHSLPAYCNNSIENVESKWLADFKSDMDFHVGTIGRLDKKYIMPMIDGVEQFIKRYGKSVQLFIFGGSYFKGVRENIEKRTQHVSGLNCVITDFIFPVPEKLLVKMDVGIGAAGAARTLNAIGLPTITMDSQDGLPIGILDVTTQETVYRKENDEFKPLEKWLEEILINRKVKKQIRPLEVSSLYKEEMGKHVLWLDTLNEEKKYFDTRKIINEGTPKTPFRMFLYRAIGKDIVDILIKSKR